jgi:hypothetical protein
MPSYEELVELARTSAHQARITTSKDVAAVLWRLAEGYQEDAARLGSKPDIGEPPDMD